MNVFKRFIDWMYAQGSPRTLYQTCDTLTPWFAWSALLVILTGLIFGLGIAPTHAQQGESYRIIYIHVPAASLSLMVYLFMAVAAAIGLIWRIKVAEMVAFSSASIGAGFTLLALITGSIWGKPTWGTWWEWDARMTSELALLFLYIGIIGLGNAFEDRRNAASATAILTLSGVVLIPFIILSVDPQMGFNTLHQARTNFLDPKEADPMITIPLFIMMAGFFLYFAWALVLRLRYEILYRERNSKWVLNRVDKA